MTPKTKAWLSLISTSVNVSLIAAAAAYLAGAKPFYIALQTAIAFTGCISHSLMPGPPDAAATPKPPTTT